MPITTGNPHSLWLFPGRHATLPLHPTSLRLRLQNLGLSPIAARTSSLRHLSTQAPPAVISHMLGYATTTTERSSRNNAATWARYAASRRQAN